MKKKRRDLKKRDEKAETKMHFRFLSHSNETHHQREAFRALMRWDRARWHQNNEISCLREGLPHPIQLSEYSTEEKEKMDEIHQQTRTQRFWERLSM